MKRAGYTFIECLIALAILLLIGTFVLRVVYGQQLRVWEAETFGPYRYFVTVPLLMLVLSGYWRRSAKEATELLQPVVRSWVCAVAGLGILLACVGLLTASK